MTKIIGRNTHVCIRWASILVALTVIMSSLLVGVDTKHALADTGGYPWANAACAWNGETSGTGYWCSDYDWGEQTCPPGDGYCTSGNKINGYYQLDQWGEGFRNCTSYVAWELNQVFGINPSDWGNGKDWNTSALAAGYHDDSSPQVGDVAQWNATPGNSWGHVAYVYAVNDGVASYDEYNYHEDGNFLNSETSSTQGSPNNWIHFGTPPPPPPIPQTPSSNSGVAYNPSTNYTQAFFEGPNNSLSTEWNNTGSWNGPTTVPASGDTGTTYSNPTAIYNPSTNFLEVFVQGPNHSLDAYWETVGAPSWSGPSVLGGSGTTYSAPAAIYNPSTNYVEVFAQGPNNSLDTYWDIVGNPWSSGSVTVGGNQVPTYSDPTAIYNPSTNFLQVFTEGASNTLYSAWETVGNPTWTGAGTVTVGGNTVGTYSDPIPIYNQSNNFLEVFTEGASNSLTAAWDTVGQNWAGQTTLPSNGVTGTTYSDPFAIYDPNTNYVEVFTQGWDNSLYTFTDTVGSPWSLNAEPAGETGWVYSDQAVTYNPADDFMQLFTEGWSNSFNLLYGTSNASGQSWTGPDAEPPATTGITYSGAGE
jgi:surface antigen